MKRTLTAAIALSLLGGTAVLAQPGRHDHGPPGRPGDFGPGHRWGRGERLPRGYYTDRRYYVNDWRARRLSAPPRGYRWVRRDDNYLLVAATTGLIASVIAASR